MIIKKGNTYILQSKTTHRHLETFNSLKAAKAREQQINFFKHARRLQG